MPYIKLKRGDDWGTVYYAPKPLNKNGMADAKRGIVFHDHRKVRIRWPDKRGTTSVIRFVKETRDVPDMGHTNQVTSQVPYVVADYRGVEILVPLEKVEVWSEDFVIPSEE